MYVWKGTRHLVYIISFPTPNSCHSKGQRCRDSLSAQVARKKSAFRIWFCTSMGPAISVCRNRYQPFSSDVCGSFAFFHWSLSQLILYCQNQDSDTHACRNAQFQIRLLSKHGTKLKGIRIQFLTRQASHFPSQRHLEFTYLCTGRDAPRSDPAHGTWLSGSRTWTRTFCRQRHTAVWTGTGSNAGYTAGLCHGRLLKTEGSEKRREKKNSGFVWFPKTEHGVFSSLWQ